MVIIEMENGKQIKLTMDRSAAPNTVDNFLHLASVGFYDGLIFHRVINGFMIQGGDPKGTGMGGPGYSIKGEFRTNGVQNALKHKRGVISMARSGNPDSAGSQFFIMHADAPHLDGQYAAFGRVTEGLEVVDEIASAPTGSGDRPKTPVRIKSIKVENEGEIKEPVKV
jgi:peptidyl-prolyl cis-trans isomerase B (cyclophilin B)